MVGFGLDGSDPLATAAWPGTREDLPRLGALGHEVMGMLCRAGERRCGAVDQREVPQQTLRSRGDRALGPAPRRVILPECVRDPPNR